MSEERRFDVLRAIVEDYVRSHEPVGSRTLVERHRFDVSPATIRNDMAQLEEDGYIVQPHTSAGRIPTEKGYRLFVDRLAAVRPLSAPERTAIERFLGGAVDLDDVLERSARLISQLTGNVALVGYPTLSGQVVRQVEVLATGTDRVLVVLITSTGQVEQRTFRYDPMPAADDLATIRARVNELVDGRRLLDLGPALGGLGDGMADSARAFADDLAMFVRSAVFATSERIVTSGAATLARAGFDSIQQVLEALEEDVVLLQLLAEMGADSEVSVLIGHENALSSLVETSIVASGYGDAGARIAALGPTHMDYAGTISAVRAVARYMTRILAI